MKAFKDNFSPEFAHELKNPVISKNDLVEIIGQITTKFKLGKLVSNFFAAIAQNRRIDLFQEIDQEFSNLLQEHENILQIEIITATKAKAAQIEKIKNLVAKKYKNKTITVKETVEHKILGGFQVK